MAIVTVSVFAFIPVDRGKVDELFEDVFLISNDIKNVRLIRTGQIAVGLNHAVQDSQHLISCWQRVCFLLLSSRSLSSKQ